MKQKRVGREADHAYAHELDSETRLTTSRSQLTHAAAPPFAAGNVPMSQTLPDTGATVVASGSKAFSAPGDAPAFT
jgi:hypothetical protein